MSKISWRKKIEWVVDRLGIVALTTWVLMLINPLISDADLGYWHFVPPALCGLAVVESVKALLRRWSRSKRSVNR